MKTQMEEQINLAHFLREEKQPALGILGIVREAIKTTIKNGKLVLSIAFFMFICYSQLAFADHFILAPVYSDFTSKYALKPKNVSLSQIDPILHKALIKDVRFILVFELIALIFSLLILMTSLAAITHSTNEAYRGKVLSFKKMLLSIRSSWKRPLITTFYMVLISLMSIAAFLVAFGLIAVMTDGSLSIALVIGLIFLVLCSYLYLSALWILSLIVSVLEENCSGMKAIDRARELIKGKKVQGCVLMLILLLASFVIYGVFALLGMKTQKSRLLSVAISVPRIWLFCLKKLFVFAVFTLFYRECKTSHPVEDKTSVYAPIASVEYY